MMNIVKTLSLISSVLASIFGLGKVMIFIYNYFKKIKKKKADEAFKVKKEELSRARIKEENFPQLKKQIDVILKNLDAGYNITFIRDAFKYIDGIIEKIIINSTVDEAIELRNLYSKCKEDYDNVFDYNNKNRNGSNEMLRNTEFIKLKDQSIESMKSLLKFFQH